jgi:hypothetical protein
MRQNFIALNGIPFHWLIACKQKQKNNKEHRFSNQCKNALNF